MSDPLARDLLEQARHLARREARRPRQASLRRAVSAAYCAPFHPFAAAGARLVCRGRHLHEADPLVRRTLDHAEAKRVCDAIRRRRAPEPWDRIAPETFPSPGLVEIAETFVLLQESRHAADYDPAARFTRADVRDLVDRASGTSGIRKALDRLERDLCLLALLFGRRLRR